jgi:general secretion pathway protein L
MTIDTAPPEAESWSDAARIVFVSWRAEIAALLRTWRDSRRTPPRDGVILDVSVAEAEAVLMQGGERHVLGRFVLNASGGDALARRLDRVPGILRDSEVRIDDALVLRTEMKMPKAPRSVLHGAVGFELDRVSPVPMPQLYYDFVLVQNAKDARRVALFSRAVRRQTVDAAVVFAHAADLQIAAIRLGNDAQEADRTQFPVDLSACLRGLWVRYGSAFLAGLAFLLLLALLAAASLRLAAREKQIADRIEAEEPRAAAVAQIEHRMDVIRAQSAYIAHRKAAPSLLSVWAALTEALPDGTWLTDLQFDAGKLRIQGFSRNASELILRLDRSGHFANAAFGAPLVRDETAGTERFDLTARAVGAP